MSRFSKEPACPRHAVEIVKAYAKETIKLIDNGFKICVSIVKVVEIAI